MGSLAAQLEKNLPAIWETWVQSLGWEDPPEEGMTTHSSILGLPWWFRQWKNLPAIWETWVQSLGWEDPLEEDMATHSSNLAWRVPMDRGAWQATVHEIAKNWMWTEQLSTQHSNFNLATLGIKTSIALGVSYNLHQGLKNMLFKMNPVERFMVLSVMEFCYD